MRLRQVDTSDDDVLERLTIMHKLTFFSHAPVYDFNVGWWWIATHGKEDAGFCGMQYSKRRKAIYLCRAGVVQRFQGQGLHIRMIRVRERAARRMKQKMLVTDTNNNIRSANNLIRCGFTMFEPETPWGLGGATYWRKEL